MAWRNRSKRGALVALMLIVAATPALAQKQYGPGASDTELKIGTTTPYSGPASAYSAGAVSATAYFTMINEKGGVNGRKINFISLDDAYSPPKTVEQIRRLIESDEVLFLVNPVEAAKGVISAADQKDPADPQWKDDPAMQAWNVWMDKYNPRVDRSDYYAPYGYNIGFAVVQLLKQCGDNLTRENVMEQASHLDMELPLLLPGIRLKTSPTDLRPIKQMRLVRFDGARYVLFSDVLASD